MKHLERWEPSWRLPQVKQIMSALQMLAIFRQIIPGCREGRKTCGRRDGLGTLPYNARMEEGDLFPLLCARCGAKLTPGRDNFYAVRIEAIADPTPPSFSDEDLLRDPRAEIERLLAQMRDLSERELMDQVYRRLVVNLCGPCYREWIEDPVK
jgi:hypothetical protein